MVSLVRRRFSWSNACCSEEVYVQGWSDLVNCSKRCSDGGIIGNETRTIIGHAEKTTSFMSIWWRFGVVNGSYFLGVWGDSIFGKRVAKKFEGCPIFTMVNYPFLWCPSVPINGKMNTPSVNVQNRLVKQVVSVIARAWGCPQKTLPIGTGDTDGKGNLTSVKRGCPSVPMEKWIHHRWMCRIVWWNR